MFLLRSKCASRHAVVVVRSHSGRIPRTNGLQQFDKGQQQTRHNHHPPVRAAESTTWINETGAVLLRGSWRPTDRAPGVDTNGGARGFLSTSPAFTAACGASSHVSTDDGDITRTTTGSASGASGARQNSEDEEGDFDDPRVAILDAALDHVHQHGFSAMALVAGAKDCGFHSVAAGMFPREGAELVHHVMAKALNEVRNLSADKKVHAERAVEENNDHVDWEESHGSSSTTDKLRAGIEASLSVVEPYRSHWPQAMGIGALPQNAGATAKALAVLADELAFLSGDRSTDLTWYGKRGLIGAIYTSTELFMLTDESEGLKDTWDFLDRRLADYETLSSAPDNTADMITGVGTVATSLSSAVVSLAGPFLRQASKQVPGGQTLAEAAPSAAALASQAFSLVASHLPYGNPATSSAGPSTATTGNSSSDPAVAAANDQPVTFAAAPERDPYINKVEPGAEGVASWQGKFEEELAREERELFGGVGRGHGKSGGRKP